MRYSSNSKFGVIFDCDGTLVDTLEDIAAAMNRSLNLHGFPPVPLEKYPAMVGWGIVRLAQLALPQEARNDETIQAVAADAVSIYNEQPLIKTKPYPGMCELAVELKSRKIRTAVLSNKPDPVLAQVIGGLFPAETFTAVRGERSGESRKPDPTLVWDLLTEMDLSPHNVLFMGDSEIDMETARNAGCYPLGVTWGYRAREELEAAGAARIIDRPDEVWELLGRRF
jgi:phosphoglycolate phosphatase